MTFLLIALVLTNVWFICRFNYAKMDLKIYDNLMSKYGIWIRPEEVFEQLRKKSAKRHGEYAQEDMYNKLKDEEVLLGKIIERRGVPFGDSWHDAGLCTDKIVSWSVALLALMAFVVIFINI